MTRIYGALLALALIATPAGAVDFTTNLTQLNGKPFEDGDHKPMELTLGAVAENALLAAYQDETDDLMQKKTTLEAFTMEKTKRYGLAQKLRIAKDVNLSDTERDLLKKLIAKSYGIMNIQIMGRAFELIDPTSIPK